jgi:Mg-chelatase subunit ChlI
VFSNPGFLVSINIGNKLRPQLLDRFPLSIAVASITSVNERVEVIKRNMDFESDPEEFYEKYRQSQDELRNKIAQARKTLTEVKFPENLLRGISKACLDLKVDA